MLGGNFLAAKTIRVLTLNKTRSFGDGKYPAPDGTHRDRGAAGAQQKIFASARRLGATRRLRSDGSNAGARLWLQ